MRISTHWRPHTEQPAEPQATALIAIPGDLGRGDSDDPLLLGIYAWLNGCWRNEETGAPITVPVYWWVLEAELLQTLPRSAG